MRFVSCTPLKFIAALLALLLFEVRVADAAGFYSEFAPLPQIAALTKLGRELFSDPSLSASGNLSCASCHDPTYAFGPPPNFKMLSDRAAPSLRYLQSVPSFTEHFHDADGDESIDQGPVGGFTWDGRAQSVHDQARLPLLSPSEMANRDARQVVAKLREGKYAAHFRKLFGKHIFANPQRAFKALLLALEVFQQSQPEFYPYTSKYDEYLRGHAKLTAPESRGLQLFNDVNKGNCASCHPSALRRGAFPQFTDFGFVALGVPRNTNASVVDLGLCGPLRTDLAQRAEYCGLFRVPSLRNVATRSDFFHNGVIHTLTDAVRFYAQRDSHPENWYPHDVNNVVNKFDDLPVRYHGNVNGDPPFGRDAESALTDSEIDDIATFLHTLTDSDVVQ